MPRILFCAIINLMFFKLVKCSERRHVQPLIINGEDAKIEDFPHSVYIYMDCSDIWTCGSSILNQKILLTAAHCLIHVKLCKGQLHAFAGHENIHKAVVTRRGKSILFHENYDRKPYLRNDIGLIFLEESLPLGNTMKRVVLTKQNSVGLTAMIAGWGIINDETKEGTFILKSATQVVRDIRTCHLWGLRPGLMCAGSTNIDLPRPTQGDSGSALVVEKHKQIGLVSFRYPSHPGLIFYTNTSYFYDWIKDNLRLLLNYKNKYAQNEIKKNKNYYEMKY
ncbi:unnamed protein product [Parnassius mnemosyne]|uniref:Peptidase S1 domain-containing protein n=1 Tax=Parnassius mnemosyne TaxID=213953 RepID=A0AAV1KLU9_9NEOP